MCIDCLENYMGGDIQIVNFKISCIFFGTGCSSKFFQPIFAKKIRILPILYVLKPLNGVYYKSSDFYRFFTIFLLPSFFKFRFL